MSLTYEEAKKLKEAGFPQVEHDYYYADCSKYGRGIEIQHTDSMTGINEVALPSLEELIEACGIKDKTFALRHEIGKKHGWYAHARMKCGKGSSPVQAVASLWIHLQANS